VLAHLPPSNPGIDEAQAEAAAAAERGSHFQTALRPRTHWRQNRLHTVDFVANVYGTVDWVD